MPQVSRKPLNKETENKVYESFFRAVGLIDSSDAEVFFNDLLTSTEKIMLSKRLAIGILLSQGKKYDYIKSMLNVSQSTISVVVKTLELSSGYRKVIKKLQASEKWTEFWQSLERLHFRNVNPGYTFKSGEDVARMLKQTKSTLV